MLLNAPLLLVPVAVTLRFMDAPPLLEFSVAVLALIPLALILAATTESLSFHFNATVASLFNATAGNMIELSIAFFAIQAVLIEVVKAAITGSIIVNVLLLIGLAAFAGGFKYKVQIFNQKAAGVASSMLLVSIIGLAVPTLYGFTAKEPTEALSRTIAIALGFIYLLSIVFTLFTHRTVFKAAELPLPGKQTLPVRMLVLILVLTTVAVAIVSELLVHSMEPVASSLGFSSTFIGLVVIAILANVAEKVSAVTFALRNQMDLAFSIGMNSATQVALFVAPMTVFMGWAMGQPMNLQFTTYEITALVASVLLVNHVASDGEVNWLEGAQLLTVYLIVVIAFYFLVN